MNRFLVEKGIKNLRIEDFISISSFGPMWVNQITSKPIQNPWGFQAVSPAKSLQIRRISFVFKGPENNPMTADCWFNAMLGFGLVFFSKFISRIQRVFQIVSKKNQLSLSGEGLFLQDLLNFYVHWMSFDDSPSPFWAQQLAKLQNKLHPYFEAKGFEFGKSHCALKATQQFLTFIEISEKMIPQPSFIQATVSISCFWKSFHLTGSWEQLFQGTPPRSLLPEKDTNPEFLIYFNLDYSPLNVEYLRTTISGEYQIAAWISYEELVFDVKRNDTINHYTCIAIDPIQLDRIWMYDDLLHLKPGGYQGVQFLLNEHKTSKLFKKVPVLLLRKKN